MKRIMIPQTVVLDRADMVDALVEMTVYNENKLMDAIWQGSGIPVLDEKKGLLQIPFFKIEKNGNSSLLVHGGAVRIGNVFCILKESVTVDLSGFNDGSYRLFVVLNESYKSLGVESFRAGVAESSTVKEYYLTVVASSSTPSLPSVEIGTVCLYGGVIPDETVFVADRDYSHTETATFSFVTAIPRWYDSSKMFAVNGREYIRINGNAMERGQAQTDPEPVLKGESIVFSPITDTRHLRAIYGLRSSTFSPKLVVNGISSRVVTMKIKPKPSIPEVIIVGVQWVNRQVVSGLMTPNLKSLYRRSIGVSKTIDGLLTESSLLNLKILSAEGDESIITGSSRELKDIQTQIVRKQSELNALRSALSAEEIDRFVKYSQKKFKAKISVDAVQSQDSAIIEQFELEVSYVSIATGVLEDKISYYGIKKEAFGYTRFGDKIYGEDVSINSFMIPIDLGQKIIVRGRAHLEDGTTTSFSSPKELLFDEYSGDSDYLLSQEIYSMLVPEYNRYARIVSEAAEIVEKLTANTTSINTQLVSLSNKMNVLETTVRDNSITIGYLNEIINRIEIKPVVVNPSVDDGTTVSEV